MKMKQLLMIALITISFASTDFVFAKEKYSEKACEDIYGAIGIFVKIADSEWKKKNDKKASFYSQVAANYSTIYETVCKK
jgi:hypothetical protein